MSTVNFEMVTELQGLLRRDFTVASKANIDPTQVNPYLDGEFYFVDDNYKLVRASAGGVGWVGFSERGRMDVQASGKMTVIMGPTYEADTMVMTATSIVTGDALKIGAVTYQGQSRIGLIRQAGSGVIIGYCTRTPARNGQKLRFIQTLF
jgi:hypothetical protein